MEIIVVGLNIFGKVNGLTSCKRTDTLKVNWFVAIIVAIVNFIETRCSLGHTKLFVAFCIICIRHFIFNEDCFKWAFGYAGPAIDTGIRVDVVPRPLFNRFARDYALHRANIYTPRISQAQTCDNVSLG